MPWLLWLLLDYAGSTSIGLCGVHQPLTDRVLGRGCLDDLIDSITDHTVVEANTVCVESGWIRSDSIASASQPVHALLMLGVVRSSASSCAATS
jgi:hypothetical protein